MPDLRQSDGTEKGTDGGGCLPLTGHSHDGFGLAKEVHLADEKEHDVAQDETQDTYGETHFQHVILLHQPRGVSNGIRRSRDREAHGRAGGQRNADNDGGSAADRAELVTHTGAHNGKDWDEQSRCCRVRNEVAQEVTDQSGEDQDNDRRERTERDALDGSVCKSLTVHA